MTDKQKRFVVYTVMVGNYDEVLQPLVVDERFDYVLFTDNVKTERIGVWQVRTFDYYDDDKTRMSRYPKMHPEELLPGYDASLYMDANLLINGPWVYERCIHLFNENIEWGGRVLCNSLYDHIYLGLLNGFDSKRCCLGIGHKLRKEGFPRRFVVYENNVIFRSFSETVKKANQLWWEYYNKFSRRDQFTLPMVINLLPEMKTCPWVPRGENTWKNGLALTGHRKGSGKVRFPYHTYSGYVQLRLMKKHTVFGNHLYNMFYMLCNCNTTFAMIITTLVSWVVFIFYAPVVYSKKYWGKFFKK